MSTLAPPRPATPSTSLLRCPRDHSRIVSGPEGLVCEEGHVHPVLAGVPVLLPEGVPVPVPAGPVARGTRARLTRAARRVARMPPTITRSHGTDENYAALARLLAEPMSGRDATRRVLVVGGAREGTGLRALLDAPHVEATETDIVLGPRTQIVCDAHALPFADATFDAVVCQGVLSELLDPARAVAEMHRVLIPGGLVYSETAFMQQTYNAEWDFTRWTLVGHRLLFRDFDVVRSGAHGGPGMALAWSLSYFLMACAGRSRAARSVVKRLSSLALWWLPLLDRRLVRSPGGIDAASGTFLLGRRREEPVADAAILASYRGAVRRAGGGPA